MPAKAANPDTTWPEAMATVTACKYDTGAGRALAFGIPSTRHFQISYNYWADGTLHTGEFASAKAVPQNTLFPIHYNPVAPHENDKSSAVSFSRSPLIAVGIIGSITLSLIWLALLHGCS